ncbi:hypothetical protein FJY68_01820 [candidate division WOR-3 bacterium]|uniref:T9SS type A sorting domain-containing protein n=1 Tax=candidate division WOR-3 bacterium TaxID=2052148 RepID=A0A937XBX1_UNCW3|nr:hypothetical protein [candidate division WOR-3 bacterium]
MYTRCSYVVLVCLLVSLTGTAAAQPDGADIQIRDGTIVATAADYEMDGTMWAAFTLLEDTSLRVHRTTDHGLNWGFFLSLRTAGIADRLGLVVGEGESAFVYLFYLSPAQNGDLQCLRFDRETGAGNIFDVAVGPDTIRDFAVCRDYTGDNYWLYAVVTNPDPPGSGHAVRFLRSSTYGRQWYITDSASHRALDPHISAGPGSYIFCTFTHGDSLTLLRNRLYLGSGYWKSAFYYSGYEVGDPVIATAFTLPESTATVWALWSENYHNSGDWDIVSSYADGGWNWYGPDYLAGSRATNERFPDLRNYTSLGNQYINASYISDNDVFRTVYRRYANAASPTQWSDTLRINEGSAGTGSEIKPKLCYTPGGPFPGAGCVFVGAGLNGCWWNAPYPTAVAEAPSDGVRTPNRGATIVRGVLRLAPSASPSSSTNHLLDISGRKVMGLVPGANDVSRLAPGVYFVRGAAEVRTVVVPR